MALQEFVWVTTRDAGRVEAELTEVEVDRLAGMRISVLVPTYDGASYIQRCFGSIAASQNLAKYVDVLYVSDDASRDRTADVVESAWNRSIPLRVFRFLCNVGECGNVNRAFQCISSDAVDDWVMLVHQDDHVFPQWIEAASQVARNAPNWVGMITGHSVSDRGNVDYVNANKLLSCDDISGGSCTAKIVRPGLMSVRSLRTNWFWTVSGSMIRASAFRQIGGFHPGLRCFADNDFLVRLLMGGFGVLVAPSVSVSKLLHNASSSSAASQNGEEAVGWAYLMYRHRRLEGRLRRVSEHGVRGARVVKRGVKGVARGEIAVGIQAISELFRIIMPSFVAVLLGSARFLPRRIRILVNYEFGQL